MKGGLRPLAAALLAGSLAAFAAPARVSGNEAAATVCDFDFVDALHGWVLLDAGSELVVRRTFDGGRLWRPVPRQFGLRPSARDRGRAAGRLRYADLRNGWVYGPGLFSTHDGGRNWVRDEVPGDVVALSPCGEKVWAVVASEAGRSLRVSPVRSSAWGDPARPAPLSGPPALVACDAAGRLWVVSGRPGRGDAGGASPGGLASTADGGRTWTSRSQPCKEETFPRWIAGSPSDGPLWLGCASSDGPSLALFRSSDAGASWQDAGGATVAVTSLAAGAGGALWSAEGAGPLRFSEDGGRTWKRSPDEGVAVHATGSFGRVLFVDALHGWAGFSGLLDPARPRAAWLFRTVDGGRGWEAHSVAGR
jgi:hypothetical protein